jgi:hypothetical protein
VSHPPDAETPAHEADDVEGGDPGGLVDYEDP